MPLNDFITFLNNNPAFLSGVVFFFGLMFGSFFNVVIYRLPIMLHQEWLENCRDFIKESYGKLPQALESNPETIPSEKYTLASPDSTCPHCGHRIRWYENIPVLSYLFLKGKCSNCKQGISIRYPIIELVTALLSGFIAFKLGFSWEMGAALIFTWCLICLTMIDADTQLLPDQITLPLLWLGLLVNLNGLFVSLHDAVIGAIAGYLLLWSVYWAFKLATGKEGMGFGDFKLLAALGAWMGWQLIPLIVVLSAFTGAVIGISLMLIKGNSKSAPMAFGPYLAVAGWIAFFWGGTIMDSYSALLMH